MSLVYLKKVKIRATNWEVLGNTYLAKGHDPQKYKKLI